MKVSVIQIEIGELKTIPKEIWRLRNQRKSKDYPDYSIIEIGQIAELWTLLSRLTSE